MASKSTEAMDERLNFTDAALTAIWSGCRGTDSTPTFLRGTPPVEL
jgi:hypothetical protein